MIVADSSAWIEFLRRTGSPVHLALRHAIEERHELGITEVVLMEVLAGARFPQHADTLRAELLQFDLLPLRRLQDFMEAAAIFRRARAAGETIRSMLDCLIAVPVIRAGAELLHNDADFDVIAHHSSLRIHPASASG